VTAKVILDSNFLFIPFQFRIDIFEELENLLGKVEPIVLSTTLEELTNLVKKGPGKTSREASGAIEFTKKCKVLKVEKKPRESYDDVILRVARELKCPVATNDARLRKRLREARVTTIFLRQKSHLDVEGYLSH